MSQWIAQLREQAARIANGSYQPDPATFAAAPEDIAALSRELDGLAVAMAERDAVQQALTMEVHHRVKNNLQIVTSLLTLQANKVQDPAVSGALGQAHARMSTLALIHRMLYERSDNGVEGSIDLDRLMTELCAQIRLWHKDRLDVEFVCDASAIALPLDSAMPLALFAVEVVTNAFAHAFPEGRSGSVSLHFSVGENGDALLRVNDDGIGFDTNDDVWSMGRQLMNAFAHQLGGSFDISSSAGSGTVVSLTYRIGDQAPQPTT